MPIGLPFLTSQFLIIASHFCVPRMKVGQTPYKYLLPWDTTHVEVTLKKEKSNEDDMNTKFHLHQVCGVKKENGKFPATVCSGGDVESFIALDVGEYLAWWLMTCSDVVVASAWIGLAHRDTRNENMCASTKQWNLVRIRSYQNLCISNARQKSVCSRLEQFEEYVHEKKKECGERKVKNDVRKTCEGAEKRGKSSKKVEQQEKKKKCEEITCKNVRIGENTGAARKKCNHKHCEYAEETCRMCSQPKSIN
jgi:hypothetical protein